MANTPSRKRLQISKANTTMVVSTAVAAFVVAFTIVAGRALLNKQSFQSRVIKEKGKAVKQLQDNITATKALSASYQAFVSSPSNVLGGNPTGTGDRDGDNAKIILDALPSTYDFPATETSFQKLLNQPNFKVAGLGGTDDELAQQANKASANPQPIPIPFNFSVQTDLNGTKNFFDVLQRSIKPMVINNVSITGSNSSLTITADGNTYYQPGKSLTIETKDIK